MSQSIIIITPTVEGKTQYVRELSMVHRLVWTQFGKVVIIINIVIVINFEITMIIIRALRRANMSVNDEWDARR